jgi:hypothetical protein
MMAIYIDDLSALNIVIFLVISERLISAKWITIPIVIASHSTHLILGMLTATCIIALDDLSLVVGCGAKITNLATVPLVDLQVVDGGQNL